MRILFILSCLISWELTHDVSASEHMIENHKYANYSEKDLVKKIYYLIGWSNLSDEDIVKKITKILANKKNINFKPYLNRTDFGGFGWPESPLMAAARRGFTKVAQLLIDLGADVNYIGSSKFSPLYFAIAERNVRITVRRTEMVRLLIDNGADVNFKGPSEWTPLFVATLFNHPEIVKMLLDHGADANFSGPYNGTALMSAENPEIAELLINAGTNVNAKGPFNTTALIRLSYQSDISKDVIEELIWNGANVNAKGQNGYNALLCAVRDKRLDLVKLLVENGSYADEIFKTGESRSSVGSDTWEEIKKPLIEQSEDPDISKYLRNVINSGMVYPQRVKSKGKTPYAYLTWADKAILNKNPKPDFPEQAVVIGSIETLMGKYWSINTTSKNNTPAQLKCMFTTLVDAARLTTGIDALMDQVWLGLDDRLTAPITARKHRMALYIAGNCALYRDLSKKLDEDLELKQKILDSMATSPIFKAGFDNKDVSIEDQKIYVDNVINKYKGYIEPLLEKYTPQN